MQRRRRRRRRAINLRAFCPAAALVKISVTEKGKEGHFAIAVCSAFERSAVPIIPRRMTFFCRPTSSANARICRQSPPVKRMSVPIPHTKDSGISERILTKVPPPIHLLPLCSTYASTQLTRLSQQKVFRELMMSHPVLIHCYLFERPAVWRAQGGYLNF